MSARTRARATLAGGQHGYWDVGFDLTGKLNESGSLLYRLNGGTGRQAFQASEVRPEQDDLAAALTWRLSPRTQVDLDFEVSRRDQLIYPGLPVPDPLDARSADDVPIENFYGEPDGSFDGRFELYTVRIDHRFSDRWSLNAGYSKNFTERNVRQIHLTGVSGNTVNRGANPFSQTFEVDTVQAELEGDLRLGGMRHRLTFTADRAGYTRTGSNNNLGTVDPIDLNDPQPTGATFSYGPESRSKVKDTGIAVQDYVEVNRFLNVLAGVRHSTYRETNPGVPDQTGESTDPTLAVILKPRRDVSVYASYASSFSPNSGTLTAPNTYAPPSEARQWELGAKA
ncbi:MAG: hypothetical protein H0U56_11155, partial [Methylibium sp.]|nr:hypothetical protein [Methylibium sp.]